ncbi:MAG: GNAT family N-acetyltransferase [Candidatus Anammoxibacter sp.]
MEPGSKLDLGVNTSLALKFHRLANKSGNNIFIHPVIEYDINRDKDKERACLRKTLLERYNRISSAPGTEILDPTIFKKPVEGSNDWVDYHLLVAVYANCVDYLVTEDIGIHKKANLIGLSSRVLLLVDAVAIIKDLFDEFPSPPPAVELVNVYELDENDPIFDSLRNDYQDFNGWIEKCKRDHRKAYVIRDNKQTNLSGICIIKQEDKLPDETTGKTLKLCTFKIAPEYEGNKYGELFLKSIFGYIKTNNYDYTYFTAFPKHQKLIMFAKDFGFYEIRTKDRELAFAKSFNVKEEDFNNLSAIDLHIKYGPSVTTFVGNSNFIIPIQPNFHVVLFPENDKQGSLFPGVHPCGNSIKKAYLSHSSTTLIKRGDNIFFYRSHDIHAITVLGIVEDTLRSNHANEIARYVGKRTVYTYKEIGDMCNKEVLAVKFRLVYFFKKPIKLQTLLEKQIINGQPQSITKLGEGIHWLQKQIKM